MRLQYMLSNGNWVDCGLRTDEFLNLCSKFTRVDDNGNLCKRREETTRNASISECEKLLSDGFELRNDASDWYSKCRCHDAQKRIYDEKIKNRPVVEMVKCSCGHTVPKNSVMSASLGSSCPDCYDRMSA